MCYFIHICFRLPMQNIYGNYMLHSWILSFISQPPSAGLLHISFGDSNSFVFRHLNWKCKKLSSIFECSFSWEKLRKLVQLKKIVFTYQNFVLLKKFSDTMFKKWFAINTQILLTIFDVLLLNSYTTPCKQLLV